MKKVVLFGGSFDPIHWGHVAIAKQARIQRKADEVWFILNQNSPFKEAGTSFKDRFRMMEIMLKPYRKYFKACDIDAHLSAPSYAYNTMIALNKQYPDIHFEWLLGSDQIPKLNQWFEFDKLNELVDFVVYKRDDNSHNYPEITGERLDISSTQIREGKGTQTHPKILEYMTREGLYLDELIQCRLSEFRYEHTLRVSELALMLAKQHGICLKRVYLAAMFHDFSKEDTSDIYFDSLGLPKAFDHAFAAAAILAKKFYIKDKQVLSAIQGHVSGHAMNPIGQILYIADKCERGRSYDSSHLVAKAMENLNEGFKAVKETSKTFLEKSKHE